MALNHTDTEQVAARLRWLRIAISKGLGISDMTQWAEFVGVGLTAWHNYETAHRRIKLDVAVKVCGKTGASLDWIYRGPDYWHTLPPQVQKQLMAADPANHAKTA